MARLLVLTDLRGVFSHGTWQTPGYIGMMLDGKVNPRPNVRCIDESPHDSSLRWRWRYGTFCGIPCSRSSRQKSQSDGTRCPQRVGTTSTSGVLVNIHVLALKADCAGFAVSCHRFRHSLTARLPLQLVHRR